MSLVTAVMVLVCIGLAVSYWFSGDFKNAILMLICSLSFLISYITLSKHP